ncbi:MAG: copper oxidase [Acidobacteria bacterium]|nr:copper oxidase [Acidobacteriota bacterium]
MRTNRRQFLGATLAGVGAAAVPAETSTGAAGVTAPAGAPADDGALPLPVVTPDLPTLQPRRIDADGVKEFHLVAEPVRRNFLPGRPVDCWGFNGTMPGPTIEVTQGDRVRLVVENRLPELFAMHWHGFEIPIEMDGVPGLTQDPIAPGETFIYEFTLHQHGTFFYHSHMAMQEMMGMIGLFIMHPREAYAPRVDRDFGLIFQEWALRPNSNVPNTLEMDFNWFTINGRAGPSTTPLLVRRGERVRVRMVNLGMDHHPIHLHGNTFETVATEGGRIPRAAWQPGNTVLVGVAQARDIEFEAKYPGDWMLHCHLPHHMMNHMVAMVGPMQMRHGTSDDAPQVPGFPQDMFMAMDSMVEKPETRGLRPTWTGGMMGMMTLVRVLEDDLYDAIQADIAARRNGEVA